MKEPLDQTIMERSVLLEDFDRLLTELEGFTAVYDLSFSEILAAYTTLSSANAGFRHVEELSDVNGSLEAIRKHLEDIGYSVG